jgi:hypothetical protein
MVWKNSISFPFAFVELAINKILLKFSVLFLVFRFRNMVTLPFVINVKPLC